MSLSIPTYAMHHDTKTHRLCRKTPSPLRTAGDVHPPQLTAEPSHQRGVLSSTVWPAAKQAFGSANGWSFQGCGDSGQAARLLSGTAHASGYLDFPSAEKEVMDWSHCPYPYTTLGLSQHSHITLIAEHGLLIAGALANLGPLCSVMVSHDGNPQKE